jgi:hypothetical protein
LVAYSVVTHEFLNLFILHDMLYFWTLELVYFLLSKKYLHLIFLHIYKIFYSGIALGYGPDDQEFESHQRLGIFLFTIMSRLALGPTQPPIQCIPGALSLGVKWLGCEADHSPPSSAEVKNAWGCTPIPPIHLHGMVLS